MQTRRQELRTPNGRTRYRVQGRSRNRQFGLVNLGDFYTWEEAAKEHARFVCGGFPNYDAYRIVEIEV